MRRGESCGSVNVGGSEGFVGTCKTTYSAQGVRKEWEVVVQS